MNNKDYEARIQELESEIKTLREDNLKLMNRNMQLDYLRILRSMYFLQTQPSWSIAACAQEAGFAVIRSFNRKFQDAIGMTPHEFRILCENNKID